MTMPDDQEYAEELRRRVEILRDHFKEGKISIPEDADLEASLLAMAGTVDIVLRHYAEIDTTGDIIAFNPRLPEHLHGLHLRLRHRKQWYELDIDDDKFSLSIDGDGPEPVTVRVGRDIRA